MIEDQKWELNMGTTSPLPQLPLSNGVFDLQAFDRALLDLGDADEIAISSADHPLVNRSGLWTMMEPIISPLELREVVSVLFGEDETVSLETFVTEHRLCTAVHMVHQLMDSNGHQVIRRYRIHVWASRTALGVALHLTAVPHIHS